MTPQEFKAAYYPAIESACRETGLNPLFVASQAALESGWGKSAIGNNLFGITAGDKWTGLRKVVRTTEYFSDDRQGGRFSKVYSMIRMADGRFKYSVDRAFRDYPSVREGILDHAKILSLSRYKGAFAYKDDLRRFAYEVARAGYCTADASAYAKSICSIANTLKNA